MYQQRWLHDGLSGLIEGQDNLCITAPSHEDSFLTVAPCNASSFAQQWSLWNARHLGEKEASYWMDLEAWERKKNSLYCFSVMMPGTDEQALLEMQGKEHKGIFACDEAAVYSNMKVDLGGIVSRVVETELHAPVGGAWHTRLNTWIFVKIWEKVLEDGRWRFNDWVVKVDPDAVFFPERLMMVVWHSNFTRAQEGKGMFINNCNGALHGALEVLSRKALDTFSRNYFECPWHEQEDWYLSACLGYLHVRPSTRMDLLADTSCKGTYSENCMSSKVAYHPFKTLHSYRQCWESAHLPGIWQPSA
jgi:hypothetical protein